MKLDEAVAKLLGVSPSQLTLSAAGGGGCSAAKTAKATVREDHGSSSLYFVKYASDDEAQVMFQGEHESLNAIHAADPSLCPKSHGWSQLKSTPPTYFLVSDFLVLSTRSAGLAQSKPSLAQKLAKLHSTPAPIPEGHSAPMFGFPVTTCCGDTPQDNSFTASWCEFFVHRRLRYILDRCEKSRGADKELSRLVEAVASTVAPRLLEDGHLNGSKGITPVVVHGDLWSGNAGRAETSSGLEDVVFDPSAFYAHSEYDLGIMRLFGGFGRSFYDEYHRLCPKTEPVSEYNGRVMLYELYHQLNHHALFGGGYRSGAVQIMKQLVSDYGA